MSVSILAEGVATITASTVDGSAISATCTIDIVSSIDAVINDLNNRVEYYTLGGLKISVENIVPGIYIRKEDDKITKVIIR
ncbi:MAG: hypothetical protein IKY67_12925 [Paludibacteraceae bacterium]|nr:hypothetical protein [Paludibacteraceae bacterium]